MVLVDKGFIFKPLTVMKIFLDISTLWSAEDVACIITSMTTKVISRKLPGRPAWKLLSWLGLEITWVVQLADPAASGKGVFPSTVTEVSSKFSMTNKI